MLKLHRLPLLPRLLPQPSKPAVATWLIVGLGNPGPHYEKTRHNAGFLFLDQLAQTHGFGFHTDPAGPWQSGQGPGFSCVKPLTWMNDSGAIFSNPDFLPGAGRRILVAVDTMDLPVGTLRLKMKAGTAGHNGLKSIQAAIGAAYIPLYIGVGRPALGVTVIDHVLGDFTPPELGLLQVALAHAATCLEPLLDGDLEAAMNRFNSWKPEAVRPEGAT